MTGYLAALTIVLLLSTVLARVLLLRRAGIQAMHFGNIDKTDFLIPPVALFYFYTIFAAAFGWPLISAQRFFESEMVAWIGVGLCFGGLLMLVLSLVSFGASFRVGIDVDHPNKLVTAGIFAVSRNPIYVAFGLVLVGRIPGISELDLTDLRCCRNLVISPAGFAGGRIYAETVRSRIRGLLQASQEICVRCRNRSPCVHGCNWVTVAGQGRCLSGAGEDRRDGSRADRAAGPIFPAGGAAIREAKPANSPGMVPLSNCPGGITRAATLRHLPLRGTLSTCCSLKSVASKESRPSPMHTSSRGAPTTTGHVEVERKFDVVESIDAPSFDGLVSIARVQRSPVQTLDAVYFDTPDRDLAAHGITLRRRTGGPDAGWHLKLPTGPDARTEIRARLGNGGEEVPAKLRDVVLAIVL